MYKIDLLNNISEKGLGLFTDNYEYRADIPEPDGIMVRSKEMIEKTGIAAIWDHIAGFRETTLKNGYFLKNRNMQARYWMIETIHERLKQNFYLDPRIKPAMAEMERKVENAEISSFEAASLLLGIYFRKHP